MSVVSSVFRLFSSLLLQTKVTKFSAGKHGGSIFLLYSDFVTRLFTPEQTFNQVLQPLTLAAMLQIDEGVITRARLEALRGVVPSVPEAEAQPETESTNGKKKGEKDKEISA